jgi:hypothetical protein
MQRSRRGSGAKLYRQDEVTDLMESLREAQGHYGRKSHSREGDAYEFTIKAHRAWPSDEVSRRIPDTAIAQQIGALASIDLEWFVMDLRERYPWVAAKWTTDGRQGGYLILFDEESVLSDLENLNLDPDTVRHSFRGQTPIMTPDRAEEVRTLIEKAKQRLKDLVAIEKEVEAAVKGFEEHIRNPETWEALLEIYAQDEDEDEDGEE